MHAFTAVAAYDQALQIPLRLSRSQLLQARHRRKRVRARFETAQETPEHAAGVIAGTPLRAQALSAAQSVWLLLR